MRLQGLILFASLALLISFTAGAAALPYEVEIDAPEAIKKLLTENLGIVRWHGSDYVDVEQLDRLYDATPAEIQTLLAPQGYFRPKVSSRKRLEAGVWQVALFVDPGEHSEVVDVTLTLHGDIQKEPDFNARYANLIENWTLPIGSPFSQQAWDAAKRRSLQALIVDRFPAASITASHGDIDPDKGTATLVVDFDSGPRFTLGELTIKGLNRYAPRLVQRMATFAPGDPYNQQKLLAFQMALQNTPYFSNVIFDVPVDAAHPDHIPVNVQVTEAPLYKVDTGLGYDTDTGARTSLGLRDANLFGRGWIGTVGFNVQQRQQIFSAGLQLPPDSDGYRYASGFQTLHQNIAGQSLWEQTLGVQRSHARDGSEITQSLQFIRSLQATDGSTGQINYALMPSESWTHRALNNPTDPSAGTIFDVQLGGAAKGFLSSASFVRAYGKLAWYIPVWDESFLRLRGEMGEVFTVDPNDVPADWLFRAGGADSVRGYGYQTLGVAQDGAIVGGRVLATGSIELQQHIVGHWRGAIFTDVGGAADRWQSFALSKGYGVGVRWGSPIGPFAGDVAYGAEERRLHFHFSLGVGF